MRKLIQAVGLMLCILTAFVSISAACDPNDPSCSSPTINVVKPGTVGGGYGGTLTVDGGLGSDGKAIAFGDCTAAQGYTALNANGNSASSFTQMAANGDHTVSSATAGSGADFSYTNKYHR